MSKKRFYAGSMGPYIYDTTDTYRSTGTVFEGEFREAFASEGQGKIAEEPTHDWHLVRLMDVAGKIEGTPNEIDVTEQPDGSIVISLPSDIKIDSVGNITAVNSIGFNTSPTHAHAEGSIHWDDDDKTLNIDTEVDGTSIQVGQENVIRVTNKTGGDLTNGQCVVVNGAQAFRPTVALADADSESLTHGVIGLLTNNLSNNQTGYMTTYGLVRDVDTSSWADGTDLFISQTAGELTSTPPNAPAHPTYIGTVIAQHATEGIIFVGAQIGYEISELHDVLITSIADKDYLAWNAASSYFENVSVAYSEIYMEGANITNCDSVTLNTGTLTSGTHTSTHAIDGTFYQITEVTGSPGFDFEFDFTVTNDPGKLTIVGYYAGAGGHNVVVEAYNYTTLAWDSFTGAASDIPSGGATNAEYSFDYDDLSGVPSDYTSGGTSKVRIYHTSPGNVTHNMYVDYIALTQRQFEITTAGTFQVATGFTDGQNLNVTQSGANGTFTITKAGVYRIEMNVSFLGTDSATFEAHAFVDGVKQSNIGLARRLGSGGDVGSTGFSGLLELSATEVLDVRFTSNISGSYASVENMNFSINKIA